MSTIIDTGRVAEHNAKLRANLDEDYAALGGMLARRGQDIEKLTAQAQSSRWLCPAGAPAPAARVSPVFRARASRATWSRSWRTAPSSIN